MINYGKAALLMMQLTHLPDSARSMGFGPAYFCAIAMWAVPEVKVSNRSLLDSTSQNQGRQKNQSLRSTVPGNKADNRHSGPNHEKHKQRRFR